MKFKETLKVFISADESANDRATAFAVIPDALLTYVSAFSFLLKKLNN